MMPDLSPPVPKKCLLRSSLVGDLGPVLLESEGGIILFYFDDDDSMSRARIKDSSSISLALRKASVDSCFSS